MAPLKINTLADLEAAEARIGELARLGLEYERLEREAMTAPSKPTPGSTPSGKLFDLPDTSATDPREGD